ncbi:MAG: PHP domain-containing protein [Clostridiales bacterium]|nr:PHP domain-containing protein [Clostridiales bacterium]
MTGDLHCHTRLSDGSMGIEDIIALAKKNSVEAIAITDHDCLAGTVRGKIIGERQGIKVIPGVELSSLDSETGRKAHILCYLADSPDRLEGLCKRNSMARKRAGQLMMLKAATRYPITPELVLKCAAGSTNLYKQHIMHALMESGCTVTIFGELFDELFSEKSPDNINVMPKFEDVRTVINEIHDAGGIAVLAHPYVYDSIELMERLTEEKMLDGIEVWHPRQNEEQRKTLEAFAKKNKLLMTGGSDFHGMYGAKPITIGTCQTPEAQFNELMGFKAKRKRQMKKQAAAAVTE